MTCEENLRVAAPFFEVAEIFADGISAGYADTDEQ
jgi:hypothetical protein